MPEPELAQALVESGLDRATLVGRRNALERKLRGFGSTGPAEKVALLRQQRELAKAIMMLDQAQIQSVDFQPQNLQQFLAQALGLGGDQRDIGRAQIQRANENPPAAPNFSRLSNQDVLKLSKAGARNLIEGTIRRNARHRT